MEASKGLILVITETATKKKRGRPPGSKRRGMKKWQPKVWKPLYEQMVALDIAGKSNIEIGKTYGYTPQQVSNILTCDKAVEIKFSIIKRVRDKLGSTVGDKLAAIQSKTIERTYDLLHNDELAKVSPIAIIKTGLAVGKATGRFTDDAKTFDSGGNHSSNNTINNVTNNLNLIGASGIATLIEALNKSDEARRINAPVSIVPAPK